MESTTIKIAIGGQEVTYHLIETTAPCSYDYGYVIVLYEGQGTRHILVSEENLAYQEGRNHSGMHTFIPSDDLSEGAITEDLWRHMMAYSA